MTPVLIHTKELLNPGILLRNKYTWCCTIMFYTLPIIIKSVHADREETTEKTANLSKSYLVYP